MTRRHGLLLTPERQRIICEAVGEGSTLRAAAKKAGISRHTLTAWRKRRGPPYDGFNEALRKALAEGPPPSAEGVGRPSSWTRAKADAALKVLRNGGTIQSAIRATGGSRIAWYNWMKSREPHLMAFAAEVKEARSYAENRALQAVADAGVGQGIFANQDPDWKAAAWLLERSLGFTKSGGAAAPVERPAPEGETPEEERVRVLEDLLTNAETIGLPPDRRLDIVRDLYEARKALGGGNDLLTEDEIVSSLRAIPPELLKRALGDEGP